jgi:hypothetical protein
MKIAVRPRHAAGIASLGVLMAMALALPSPASASTLTCRGHVGKAQDTEDYENALDYTFACTGRILGYMIVSDRELDAFDTEIEVHDAAGAIVPSDGFACEGDIPGFGVGCFGTYSTNNVVTGTVSVADHKVCDLPRVNPMLVVVPETIDTVTGLPKKTANGSMAGPFELDRPRGCPKSSILGGLLAEVAQMRAEIRADRGA